MGKGSAPTEGNRACAKQALSFTKEFYTYQTADKAATLLSASLMWDISLSSLPTCAHFKPPSEITCGTYVIVDSVQYEV